MEPPPAAIICGNTAFVVRNMPLTLMSCSQSHSSSVVSRKGLMTMVPAWLNSTVIGPKAALTAATPASTSTAFDTSALTRARHRRRRGSLPPFPRLAARLWSRMPTFAPSAAKSREAAPPMPVAPPVISAIFPSRRPGMMLPPLRRSESDDALHLVHDRAGDGAGAVRAVLQQPHRHGRDRPIRRFISPVIGERRSTSRSARACLKPRTARRRTGAAPLPASSRQPRRKSSRGSRLPGGP